MYENEDIILGKLKSAETSLGDIANINDETITINIEDTLSGTQNDALKNIWSSDYTLKKPSILDNLSFYAKADSDSLSVTVTILILDKTNKILSKTDKILTMNVATTLYNLKNLRIFVPIGCKVGLYLGDNAYLTYSMGGDYLSKILYKLSGTVSIGNTLTVSQTINGFAMNCSKTFIQFGVSTISSLITSNPLFNKTFNVLGDSMVHGHTLGFDKTWAYKLGARNNMTVRDYGINGTCLAGTSNAYGSSMATRYTSMDNDADFICVFGGTNDQVSAIPIGTDSDSTVDTFKGALNILCDGLITKYPSAKIFFITPYHRSGFASDYADAIITICGKYGIPVFDNYRKGGVCWTNAAQVASLTMNDTYHLNEAGHEYASTKYEADMKAL